MNRKLRGKQKCHQLVPFGIVFFVLLIGIFWSGILAKGHQIKGIEESLANEYTQELAASAVGFDFEFSAQNVFSPITSSGIKVPILIYHIVRDNTAGESYMVHRMTVPPAMLDKEFKYLKDNDYHVISFNDLVDNLQKNKILPSKPIILTFDDGWEMGYKTAFPILKKYNYTATFFIFSNGIGRKHYLTWDEINEMQNAGMTIGGHSKSHPTLVDIHNENILRNELVDSKKVIESHIGRTVDLFAYPFGHPNDEIIKVLKEAGYKAARTTYIGSVHTLDNIYTLKGIIVDQNFDNFVKSLQTI